MQGIVVDYMAVLTAGIVGYVVGALWYSPILFGKVWMREMNMSTDDMKGGMSLKMYIIGFVATLVMSYVLYHVLAYSGAENISSAAQGGFWLWLGFVATILINSYLYESKTFKLYLINASHYLAALLIMSMVIVSMW